VIKKWDDPLIFFDIERVKASIVWGSYGFLEYKVPLREPFEAEDILRIEIILEVSAQGELTSHRALSLPESVDKSQLTDGISDLTFWINGVEAGTVTVEEYSRGSGGKYTPTWWKGSNYGKQVKITLEKDMIRINDIVQKNSGLVGLNIKDYLQLKVGIKQDAKNKSGFNIYGSHFGNFGNDILVRIFDNRSL
jgi:predicted transcriptional regulator